MVDGVTDVESIDIEDVRISAVEAVEHFHDEHSMILSSPNKVFQKRNDNSSTLTEIGSHLDFLNIKIAELLETDQRDIDEIKRKTIYNEPDPDRSQILKNIGAMPLNAITDYRKGNMYGKHIKGTLPFTDSRICVSSQPLESEKAYSVAASELLHEFQYQEDSPTKRHPYLNEGLDNSVKIRCLEYGVDEGIISPRHRDEKRAEALVEGYMSHLYDEEGLEPSEFGDHLIDLELLGPEVRAFAGNLEDSMNGIKYDIGASAVLSAVEEFGDEVYAEVFNGDYSRLTETVKSPPSINEFRSLPG